MNQSPPIDTKTTGAVPRILAQAAPFFLPFLFFQSALFAIISPLPLFLLTLRRPLWQSVAAILLNSTFMVLSGAPTETAIALFFWFGVGILFPFLIRRSGKVQLSLGLSFVYLAMILVLSVLYFAKKSGLDPVQYVRLEIGADVERVLSLPESPLKAIVEQMGKKEFYRELLTELPSSVLIALLVTFWINLIFASQIFRGFLAPSFWSNYRNPEWLVWPSLAFGALYAFSSHAPYFIGLCGFRVVLVFYAFQGLSVLSFLLNRYKIFGFGRALLFSIAIFVTLPLVLSLGFFDLWFDFRRKFGQS